MPAQYDPNAENSYGAMGINENWYGGNASDVIKNNQYQGNPGGGYQANTDQLWNLALNQNQGPNATIDYNMGQYQQGPQYGGQAGGDQRNLQFGYGGQMTKYNEMPQFQAASQQIDEQTAAEQAKLKEEFGDAGMRMSTPLMAQMGQVSRNAANDKNKLLLDMDREETQKAWERQMEESNRMYNRGKDTEQETYNRWDTGDKKNYDQWMGQQQLGWDVAKGKGDLQNRQWDSRFGNAMSLDNSMYGRANDQEAQRYGRYRNSMQDQLAGQDTDYNRWWQQQQNQQDMMKWGSGLDAQASQGEDNWWDRLGTGMGQIGAGNNQQAQQQIAQQMQQQQYYQQQLWNMMLQQGGMENGVNMQVNDNTPWWQNPGLWGGVGSMIGGMF
jgi:hypothetical protein